MCQDCLPQLNLQQGLDGFNSYTIVTANFVMPAEGSNVTVNVSNIGQYTGAWAIPGQIVYIQTAGYFQVVSSTSTSIILTNIENSSTGAYSSNAAPSTNISSGNRISPAGIQGPTGSSNGNTLIDIDYTNYNNATTGSFTTQKSINLPSAIFSTNKDTIELQCNFINKVASGNSKFRIILGDGTNFVNLLPANFTSGIDLLLGASTETATFAKFHISRASATTINIILEIDSGIGNTPSDMIFNSLNSTLPLTFKYKTSALGPITLSGTLTLTIDTNPGDSNGVELDFVKCIKQKLV